MPKDIDVKIKYAYLELKRKLGFVFTIWLLALLASATLLIANFFLNIPLLKMWSSVLAIMLLIKVAFDIGNGMNKEYAAFKNEHPEILKDNILRPFQK